MSTIDIVIAAAHEMELVGLGPRGSNAPGLRVETRAIGVGLPAATAGAARALAELRPSALILLGSCGVYRSRSTAEILAPVVPDTLQLIDAAVVAGDAAYPDVMPSRADADRLLSTGLAGAIPGAVRGGCATTLGITTSDRLAVELAETSSCEFENLEAIGVALACREYGVRFAAVLVVTNVVGASGRDEWRKHFRPAADGGGKGLLGWIESGADGLRR